ncbi:MAG: Flp pilus assembly complex ATPase component TadA [Planctomycetes bacterium]|nr:Flp pilus assembly complex ATPase component TadA [Planctomycetota bacterium]
MIPSTSTDSFSLPSVLNGAHREEFDALWAKLSTANNTVVDASAVVTVDSVGLQMLVDGVHTLHRQGRMLIIENVSEAMSAACRSFRLHEILGIDDNKKAEYDIDNGTRLGEVLTQLGFLSEDDLSSSIQKSSERPDSYLGQILLEEGHINSEELARALAAQHGLPYVDPVSEGVLDVSLECEVPFAELRVHGILPYLRLNDTLAVALKDPADVYASDVVRKYTGLSVITTVTTPEVIGAGLDQLQRAQSGSATTEGADEDEVPIEERFNEIVVNAIIEGASDIHVEPFDDCYFMRYRVDGHLHEVASLSLEIGSSLVARIKVAAGCDISEKRLPQDGRIHYQDVSRDVDLRVNTLPTVHGEKAVMRILDRNTEALALKHLGLTGNNELWLNEAINLPHGMVLVTGPTGSGKTTTLYSVLDEIVSPEINVSTVENPVERAVKGVNQTQVNYKAGLSFELCLRALLRQDPDVIMIGEIRDKETAEIAIEAALTGHLVLATLHTNDAPGAASRLIQMGVEPFLVAATLRAVVAQRLVRKLCDSCKRPVEHPEAVHNQFSKHGLKQEQHFSAAGCPACRNTGYDGRRGVFEVMKVTNDLQDLIACNPSTADIRKLAITEGMDSLLSDAFQRVNIGITTVEEALRAGGKA